MDIGWERVVIKVLGEVDKLVGRVLDVCRRGARRCRERNRRKGKDGDVSVRCRWKRKLRWTSRGRQERLALKKEMTYDCLTIRAASAFPVWYGLCLLLSLTEGRRNWRLVYRQSTAEQSRAERIGARK